MPATIGPGRCSVLAVAFAQSLLRSWYRVDEATGHRSGLSSSAQYQYILTRVMLRRCKIVALVGRFPADAIVASYWKRELGERRSLSCLAGARACVLGRHDLSDQVGGCVQAGRQGAKEGHESKDDATKSEKQEKDEGKMSRCVCSFPLIFRFEIMSLPFAGQPLSGPSCDLRAKRVVPCIISRWCSPCIRWTMQRYFCLFSFSWAKIFN